MLNIFHIHTDLKFLNETERFSNLYFSNTIIFIGEDIPYEQVKRFNPIVVSPNFINLKKVIDICSSADMVVLYELDRIKSYIALRIPINISVAWRFFGAELYNKNLINYLSYNSLKYNNTKKEKFNKLLNPKIIYRKISSIVKNILYTDKYFMNVIKRVDIFLCLSNYEYDHLTKAWTDLPPFVQIPLDFKETKRNINNKKDLVIIGHSRSIFNNHIDIIELIEKTRFNDKLRFIIPFSYCPENYYTNKIKSLLKISSKQFHLLEDFMPYETYFNHISNAKAAIFNTYRQMGMGNIFQFMYSGIKIYLNKSNVIYQWFKDLGLKIFTIEEFARDLETNNLELSLEDKENNINILNHFSSMFSEDQLFVDVNLCIKNKILS